MNIVIKFFLIFFLIFCLPIEGGTKNETIHFSKEAIKEILTDGITVDLRNPEYSEGVLTTEEGGVITGPGIRIQARRIRYTKKSDSKEPEVTIEAEGDLMVEYGCYFFVGDSLFYDFQKEQGFLLNGRSTLAPWYFGGDRIDLLPGNNIEVINGYITTSENLDPDWAIQTKYLHFSKDHILYAKDVQFRAFNVPIFWLPVFKTNLDWIIDSPIRYRIRWGGKQGLRVGMIYEVFTWNRLKTFVRFDYRLNRGPGGGIETDYESANGKEKFYTVSYMARDSSIEEPKERTRYRFEGIYTNRLDNNRTWIDFSYDKMSDKEMTRDYYDKGLDLGTLERTQLYLRRQQNQSWIGSFFIRSRINDFQTINQELPTFAASLRPLTIGNSKIISQSQVVASYLNFKYANDQRNIPNYQSTRFEFSQTFYRPVYLGPFVATPEVCGLAIFYGNSPKKREETLAFISFAAEVKSSICRSYCPVYNQWGSSNTSLIKHIIEPYTKYEYIPRPTITPREHFIFDLNDGWYRVHTLRMGIRNIIYAKKENIFSRYLTADLFAYQFFNTPTIPLSIPKVYAKVVWDIFSTLRYTLDTAWDFKRKNLSYINFRSDWTVNENLALAAEYRHRNSFSWRKLEPFNFNLESFRSEKQLVLSQLSDRRDTIIFHFFYRFLPDWACEFQLHSGWNRKREPNYLEYQADFIWALRASWNLRFSYQRREDDHRIAAYISLGAIPPCLNTPD